VVEHVASSDGLLRKGMLSPRSPNSRFRMMRKVIPCEEMSNSTIKL
jgi:hypothetical protein